MLKARMICDLENPISQHYTKLSIESFSPVSDLVQIEPFQCYTPETMPDFDWCEKKGRALTEKAILYSYYTLMKQLAEGEKFIIMEHDAYLRPDYIDLLVKWLPAHDKLTAWNPGIAIEFHTVTKEVAEHFVHLCETDNNHDVRGPMAMISRSCDLVGGDVLYPVTGETNQMCYAQSVGEAHRRDGEVWDAPVTQMVDMNIGVTNKRDIYKKPLRNIHFL